MKVLGGIGLVLFNMGFVIGYFLALLIVLPIQFLGLKIKRFI